jgi:SAM-dependent methyltransferase
MSAAARWAEALAEWALPQQILSTAPEPPWHFPVEAFGETARRALDAAPTPTHRRVAEAIPSGGALLDVGCGAGAASLPAIRAARLKRLVAVDYDPLMLDAFARLAREAGLSGNIAEVKPVEGPWPTVAPEVGTVDVAVCANVAYNVADLGSFIQELTAISSSRVVLELTASHPQAPLSPLWEHFWGLRRPALPTADDAQEVITEVLGFTPDREAWTGTGSPIDSGPDGVARVRRRLCLPSARDPEVAAFIGELGKLAPRAMVTFWWPGRAHQAPA